MRRLCMAGMILVFVVMSAGSAFAAGFALIEQSVKGLGTAFSGGAAVAENPSTVFFNPAGMTRLEGQQATAGLHVIVPSAEFELDSASNALTGTIYSDAAGTTQNESGEAGQVGTTPNLYYTHNLGNDWTVGFGVNVPFGLATEYDKDWVGRYHGVNSEVMTVNINPSIAYKVNDQLSLGAGVSAMYMEANLSQMIDFGLSSGVPALASNPIADVYADINADSWGYGYNLGALYEFNEDTRVGLSYRSEVKQDLEGDADFTTPNLDAINPLLTLGASAAFPDQGASGTITLPASAQLSVYHEVLPGWAVMADIMWTEWSSFEDLTIEFDQGIGSGLAKKASTTQEQWDDNMRYSVGTAYALNDEVTLRGGLAYDETPIPDEYRTPRIPGADRFWIALGGGYAIDAWSVDVAYAHLFVDDGDVDLQAGTDPTADEFGRGNLSGSFENSVDIVSVEVSYKF
ncbi:MAG: hypothetical protein C0624_06580 [Desulfuromonas sp.]|nr:MAG: hypothetical protein C0624_06580 [Desulfuromonas sp.]